MSAPVSLKKLLGLFPSWLINRRLRAGISNEHVRQLVRFANEHPNWLGLVDDHVSVQTNFGFSIYCDRHSGIGQTLLADGQWEGLLSRTILACLKPGETAMDIGANIGYDTLLMSQAVGPTGMVLAFEPVVAHFTLLLKNIRHVSADHVIAQNLALSNESVLSKIALSTAYNSGMPNLRPGATGPTQAVMATRLDSLLRADQVPHIAFVKIDIEGFEFKALQGMGGLIDSVDHLSCEVNTHFLAQCGSSAEDLFSYMGQHGFTSFCAAPYSDGKWTTGNHQFQNTTAQGPHFDALFCRHVGNALQPLIQSS